MSVSPMAGIKIGLRRHLPRIITWPVLGARMYWMSGHEDRSNFGDQLSPLIVEGLFKLRFKYSGIDAADLIAVGSLLNFGLTHMTGQTKPVVWGSGFIHPGDLWSGHPVEWRAVRGELSRARVQPLTKRSVAVGDPGILAPLAFPGLARAPKRYRIGVVPHYADTEVESIRQAVRQPDAHFIDVVRPAAQVLQEIAACEVILSSSLHGLVVAEALGIPNAWTPVGDNLDGGSYKFEDYFSGFQTEAHPQDLLDVVRRSEQWEKSWNPLPGKADQIAALIKAFPATPRAAAHAQSPERPVLVSEFP